MGHRMGDVAAGAGQRVGLCLGRVGEAALQRIQALAGLIVEFIGNQRLAVPVIAGIPALELLVQGSDLHVGLGCRPVRAMGLGRQWDEDRQQEQSWQHGERPCPERSCSKVRRGDVGRVWQVFAGCFPVGPAGATSGDCGCKAGNMEAGGRNLRVQKAPPA